MPAVEVSAPPRSNLPGCRFDSLMYSGATAARRTPIGTLTNSTQRHDSHDVSTPPRSRPRAPPATATAPNTPKARLRSSPSSKLVVISASAVAGAAAEQQQPAEGERVRVQHPRQAGGGEAQGLLDLWQGDVDDGRVQHDHELRRRDDGERERGVVAAPRPAGGLRALGVGDRHGLLPPLG